VLLVKAIVSFNRYVGPSRSCGKSAERPALLVFANTAAALRAGDYRG